MFVDPNTAQSYLFHLALFTVEREADPDGDFPRSEILEYRLVGIRQAKDGTLEECAAQSLLLLKGREGVPISEISWIKLAKNSLDRVCSYILQQIATKVADERRQSLLVTLEERQDFLKRGYDFQAAQFAMTRAKVLERERSGTRSLTPFETSTSIRNLAHARTATGDREAKAELLHIKERQKLLGQQLEKSLRRLAREPQLIVPKKVTFLAHALVVPSQGEADRQEYNENIEKIAMQVAIAYEESKKAHVMDVSTPGKAQSVGLIHWPGFDLLSKRPDGEERAIEVKGRANVGSIELSTNEWVKACNLHSRYWLYVVFDCATERPRLLRICDPFGRLLGQPRGGAVIEAEEIVKNAEL